MEENVYLKNVYKARLRHFHEKIITLLSIMKISDITLSIFIILIFVLLLVFNILLVGIKNIENNWPEYRCNPMVMPFASVFGQDTVSNFTYCIQTMQTNYMNYLMQPLNYNFNVINELGSGLTTAVNDIRAFFDNIRDMITSIIQEVFGVFLNLLVELQRLTINIKDLFSKIIRVLAVLLYTIMGSINTMQSAWAGPPGQMVQQLCFEPETKIQTKDGLIAMKDLPLGTILKNGSRVRSVLRIHNLDDNNNHIEPLFKVGGGENNESIYVSGSHLIFDPLINEFVKVKNLRHNFPCEPTEKNCDEFTCLITSDHTIPIGKRLFHDWEDNNGSPSKSLV